mgnify:CR=1 FL=1
MGQLTVRALRAVLVVVLAGTVFVQAGMVWARVNGYGPEDGSLPRTAAAKSSAPVKKAAPAAKKAPAKK